MTSIAWTTGGGKPGGCALVPASTTTTRRAVIIANEPRTATRQVWRRCAPSRGHAGAPRAWNCPLRDCSNGHHCPRYAARLLPASQSGLPAAIPSWSRRHGPGGLCNRLRKVNAPCRAATRCPPALGGRLQLARPARILLAHRRPLSRWSRWTALQGFAWPLVAPTGRPLEVLVVRPAGSLTPLGGRSSMNGAQLGPSAAAGCWVRRRSRTSALGGGEVKTGRDQYLQALASLRELTRTQAERVAGLLAKQGEAPAGQASRIAEDLLRRTRKNREQVNRLIEREVKRQLGAVGIATRDEVARLQQRVRALEQAAERASRPAGARTRAPSSRARTPRTSARPPGGTRRGRGTTKATGTGPGGVTESTATPSNAAGTGTSGA
jgi:polyhydroxyalkanoate synthesis regulator phasin